MSLFRKPKKHIQRRVFSSLEDDEVAEHRMEVDEEENTNTQPVAKIKKHEKKERIQTKQTLLSFGDEGDRSANKEGQALTLFYLQRRVKCSK